MDLLQFQFGFIFGVLADLLMFGATVYALSVRPSPPIYLMAGGTSASLLSTLFYTVLNFLPDIYDTFANFFDLVSAISTLGYMAFVAGFFIFMYQQSSQAAQG